VSDASDEDGPGNKIAAEITSRRPMPELPIELLNVAAISAICVTASARRSPQRRTAVAPAIPNPDLQGALRRAGRIRLRTPSASSANDSAANREREQIEVANEQIKLVLAYRERDFAARDVTVGGERLPAQRVAARLQRSVAPSDCFLRSGCPGKTAAVSHRPHQRKERSDAVDAGVNRSSIATSGPGTVALAAACWREGARGRTRSVQEASRRSHEDCDRDSFICMACENPHDRQGQNRALGIRLWPFAKRFGNRHHFADPKQSLSRRSAHRLAADLCGAGLRVRAAPSRRGAAPQNDVHRACESAIRSTAPCR